MLLLVSVLIPEILLAAFFARKLRLCENHMSFLEIFILAHLYFFVFCLVSCRYFWSGATTSDLWSLVPLIGLSFVGLCFGALAVRGIAGNVCVPYPRETEPETPKNIQRLIMVCVLFWIVSIGATLSHPTPWYVLITAPYWARSIDATQRVPLFLLNSLAIVPVLLLGTRLFDRRTPFQRLIWGMFAAAIFLQVLQALITGARGRLLNIVISFGFLVYYLGSRRAKRVAPVAVAVGVAAFVFFSLPLRVYRDTGSFSGAYSVLTDKNLYEEWLQDPGNESVDFCMLSLDYYENSQSWRGLDSVTGVLAWFVPRRFWTNKPINFGNIMWLDVLGKWTLVGVGPTFLGEFYACAGPFGLLPISFVFGAFLAMTHWLLLRYSSSRDYYALTACLAYASIIVVRGDFISTFGRSFMLILPSYFALNWLSGVTVNLPELLRGKRLS